MAVCLSSDTSQDVSLAAMLATPLASQEEKVEDMDLPQLDGPADVKQGMYQIIFRSLIIIN